MYNNILKYILRIAFTLISNTWEKTPGFVAVVLIVLFSYSSCKKEEKNPQPTLTFISPAKNEVIYLPYDINLQLTIKAEKSIKFIQVGIVNYQNATVFELGEYYTDSTAVEINQQLSLGLMDIGFFPPFFLVARVIGGDGTYIYEQPIELINPNLQYKGFFVTTEAAADNTTVYYFDEHLNKNLFATSNATFESAETNAFHDVFCLATNNPARLQTYTVSDKTLLWEEENKLSPFEITATKVNADNLYVASSNGVITSFEILTGSFASSTQLLEDSIPRSIGVAGGLIAADFLSKDNNSITLVTFDEPTGSLYEKRPLNFIITDFFTGKYGYNFLVFGNETKNGVAGTYQPLGNFISDLKTIPQGTIDEVVQIDADRFFIKIENTLFLYDYLNADAKKLKEFDEEIVHFDFEWINKKLVIAFIDRVEIYSYPEIELQGSVPVVHPVKDVHLRHKYIKTK